MPLPPFWRDIEVDISDNESAGVSDAYWLGQHAASGNSVVPMSIQPPSNLQGVDRLKFQVSETNATSSYLDVQDEYGNAITVDLTAATVVPLPSIVQVAIFGFAYFRLVCLDGTDVAEEPSADITFRVRFGYAEGAS